MNIIWQWLLCLASLLLTTVPVSALFIIAIINSSDESAMITVEPQESLGQSIRLFSLESTTDGGSTFIDCDKHFEEQLSGIDGES